MPTPIRFFIQVAQEYGNIDPDDMEAVESWYITDFPKLPKKDLIAIMDLLIEHDNELPMIPKKIIYPSDIPLPLIKDTIPITGMLRKNLYRRLINYLSRIIRAKK